MSNKYKVRDKRRKGYFTVDNEYLNGLGKSMGPTGIAVYMVLCRHADAESETCFPAQERIAEMIGCSRATVQRYLRLLKKHNIVAIERVKEGRKWAHNVYWLLDKSEWVYPQKGSRITETHDVHASNKQASRINDADVHASQSYTNNTHSNNTHITKLIAKKTPKQLNQSFFELGSYWLAMLASAEKHPSGISIQKEMHKFLDYWTEPNSTGTKDRWQMQKTFDVKRRLAQWLSRSNVDYKKNTKTVTFI